MLYNAERSAVRIVLWKDDFSNEQYKKTLEKFRESSGKIVGEYPKIYDGYLNGNFHAVLTCDQGYEERTMIDARIFQDNYWVEVEEKLRRQLDKLLLGIERFEI